MSDIYTTRFTPADLKKPVSFHINLANGRSFNEVVYPGFPAQFCVIIEIALNSELVAGVYPLLTKP